MASVLIADDSMFQRFLLAKIVTDMGHTVLQAKSGQECLDMALANKPGLILLDLNMPGLDGVGTLECLCDTGHGGCVVVITADIQSTTRSKCLALGAHEVLNKPLDEDALRALLTDLLPAVPNGPAQSPA